MKGLLKFGVDKRARHIYIVNQKPNQTEVFFFVFGFSFNSREVRFSTSGLISGPNRINEPTKPNYKSVKICI